MYSAILVLALGTAIDFPGQLVLGPPLVVDCPPIFLCPPCPCPSPCPPANTHQAQKPNVPQDIVLRWNEEALQAIKAEKTPPPVAARNLAIVHGAIYDAVNAVHRTHQPFHVAPAQGPGLSCRAAAIVAAHRTLTALYPKQQKLFDAAYQETMAAVPEGQARTGGMALGQSVGEKYLEWRKRDTENGPPVYRVQGGPGRWVPTPPDFRPPLLPEWSALQPFGVRDPAEFRPKGPPPLNGADFAASFNEVKALGAANSRARTPEQTEIAWFWADGDGTVTPPGHWNRIAQAVAAQRGNTMVENARLFAMLNVALADAAIVCWECKYRFDYWRPVTSIRTITPRENGWVAADPNWSPLLVTPPFPSYTSGHSTFSGAAATALAGYFGRDDFPFATTGEGAPGTTRKFARFSDAAAEAGRSRIYGGIHYDFDDRDGQAVGRAVAEHILKQHFQPIRRLEISDRGGAPTLANRQR